MKSEKWGLCPAFNKFPGGFVKKARSFNTCLFNYLYFKHYLHGEDMFSHLKKQPIVSFLLSTFDAFKRRKKINPKTYVNIFIIIVNKYLRHKKKLCQQVYSPKHWSHFITYLFFSHTPNIFFTSWKMLGLIIMGKIKGIHE